MQAFHLLHDVFDLGRVRIGRSRCTKHWYRNLSQLQQNNRGNSNVCCRPCGDTGTSQECTADIPLTSVARVWMHALTTRYPQQSNAICTSNLIRCHATSSVRYRPEERQLLNCASKSRTANEISVSFPLILTVSATVSTLIRAHDLADKCLILLPCLPII